MIVTTTPVVEGRPVKDYLGVVTGEAIIGANVLKDILAAVRDVIGGHAGAYEDALRRAREEALRASLCRRATSREAFGHSPAESKGAKGLAGPCRRECRPRRRGALPEAHRGICGREPGGRW